jgi:hypothetical protein
MTELNDIGQPQRGNYISDEHKKLMSLPVEFISDILPANYELMKCSKITMDDLIEARKREPTNRREKIISRLKWSTVVASWGYGLRIGIDFGTVAQELKDNAPWLLSMYGYGNLLYLLGFRRMYQSFKDLGLSIDDIAKSRELVDIDLDSATNQPIDNSIELDLDEQALMSGDDDGLDQEKTVTGHHNQDEESNGFIRSRMDAASNILDVVRVASSETIVKKLYGMSGYRKGLANTAMGFVICSIPWSAAEYMVLPKEIKVWGPSIIGGNALAAYNAWQIRMRIKPKKENNGLNKIPTKLANNLSARRLFQRF